MLFGVPALERPTSHSRVVDDQGSRTALLAECYSLSRNSQLLYFYCTYWNRKPRKGERFNVWGGVLHLGRLNPSPNN